MSRQKCHIFRVGHSTHFLELQKKQAPVTWIGRHHTGIVLHAMGKLKLFYDGFSQPCRALYIFLKLNNIEFEIKQINLVKGETTSAEYLAVNPYGAVPCIDDDGFILPESVAIFKYLCNKYDVPDHWYPQDLRKRARIDQYLAWQHSTIRRNGTWIMLEKSLITVRNSDEPYNQKTYDGYVKGLQQSLKKFEDLYIGDHSYIFGDDMSIADLLAAAELVQAIAGQYDIEKNHPKTFSYIQRVRARSQPHYDECFRRILYEGDRVAEGKVGHDILPTDPDIL